MITAHTLQFLTDLHLNNNTPWFHANRPRYEQAKHELTQLCTTLIEQIATFDAPIAQLLPKDCTFRINRDIRFSANKSPYKNNLGAYFVAGGKKSPKAGYYLHIEPNNQSFFGGGLYQPDPRRLAAVRQEIDYHTTEFTELLANTDFVNYFGQLSGDRLKTPPKGYPKDHPAVELLKYKDFTMFCRITDEQVLSANFIEHSVGVFKAMKPINDFLNHAIEGVGEDLTNQ